ncbi:hypothetical protein M426DRAFT_9052 [Hypoxylon sp. CI-4A]|nr:hypothetical protein M426DRAFT_9052 [Hypoxylon sp. CI-4A]
MGINALFYTGMIVAINVACTPYRRNWDKTIPGHCIDTKQLNLVSAIINLIIDVAILLLPQRVIWGLRISSFKKKVGISAVFAIGVGACVAAACRIYANVQWDRSRDMTYHFSSIALSAIAEITCGILILCVPSTPKALGGIKPPEWVSSLNSWFTSSINRVRMSKGSSESMWSRRGASTPTSRAYEFLNEPDSDAIDLASLEAAKLPIQRPGILKTTEIVSTESPGMASTSRTPDLRRQPWVH